MKVKKSRKILITIAMLFIAILLLGSTKVEATTNHTADEAINWVKSKVGTRIDVDGYPVDQPYQCVDLIMSYYRYLVGYNVSGNGGDYSWNQLPDGWTRLQGAQPQKGDILVYTDGGDGHVGIYESDYSTYHQNVDGNYIRQFTIRYNEFVTPYWGVVRPDFSNVPKITYLGIDTLSITSDTMTAMAWLSDNTNVSSVQMRIWRTGYTSDTGTTKNATYNSTSNCWQVTFTESDIKKGTNGTICIEAWAYKNGAQSNITGVYDLAFAGRVTNIGSFKARIMLRRSSYCLGISGTNDGADVKLKSKDLSDQSQIWGFTELSNGNYRIYNVYTNKYLSLEGGENIDKDGGIAELSSFNSTRRDQQFMIQSYNYGYRLVPSNTGGVRGLAVKDGTTQDNQPIVELKDANSTKNTQTWYFEKIITDISLDKTNMDLLVGGMGLLNVEITPTASNSRNYTLKSSNPEIATIDSQGYVTAVSEGTTTITCKTTDGSNITRTCTVNVYSRNGLSKYNGKWCYLKDGKIDTNFTDLVKYNGSWFYVQNGVLNWGVETLVKHSGTWYYVKNSTLDWNYTGLFKYNGSWYYIQKGTLKWGVETLVKYYGTWYYVKNSTLDWNYTSLFKYNGSWYYIQKGTLKWGVETLVKYYGTWYYVKNSTLDWNYTGLCKYGSTTYYIQKGILKWGYNGTITFNGKKYTIKDSRVV